MMVLAAGLVLIIAMALAVYRKRRRERFFDPHHQQAFDVLNQSFPDAAERDKPGGKTDA